MELLCKFGGLKLDETPPAYSLAAKKAMDRFKGNKAHLFLKEAVLTTTAFGTLLREFSPLVA